MSELSPPIPESARKTHAAILKALAAVGQNAAGEAIGKSESWVSRWKVDDSELCARVLAACGLKAVPVGYRCYAPEYIEHLRYFAQHGMAQHAPPELEWGDE